MDFIFLNWHAYEIKSKQKFLRYYNACIPYYMKIKSKRKFKIIIKLSKISLPTVLQVVCMHAYSAVAM